MPRSTPPTGRRLRAGVVGLGFGRYHVAALAGLPDVEIVGMAQRHETEPTRERFAAHYRAPVHDTPGELLDTEDLDLLVIASRPSTHLPLLRDAVDRGVAVLVEKPLAGTLADARAIADLTESTGAWIAVNFEMRYLHPVQELRRLLREGALGQPMLVTMHYVMDPVPADSWIWTEAEGASPLVENSVHAFDLVRYLVGDLELVHADAWNAFGPGSPQPDVATASLRSAAGARVSLTLGAIGAAAFEVPMRLHVYGSAGQAVLEGPFHTFTTLTWASHADGKLERVGDVSAYVAEPPEFDVAPLLSPGVRRVVEDLQAGRAPDADALDGLAAQLLAEQVRESRAGVTTVH